MISGQSAELEITHGRLAGLGLTANLELQSGTIWVVSHKGLRSAMETCMAGIKALLNDYGVFRGSWSRFAHVNRAIHSLNILIYRSSHEPRRCIVPL
jgi:hypothetical protein